LTLCSSASSSCCQLSFSSAPAAADRRWPIVARYLHSTARQR
jgi:hypothetical protein